MAEVMVPSIISVGKLKNIMLMIKYAMIPAGSTYIISLSFT